MAPIWGLESDLKSFGKSAEILAAERLAKLADESEEIKDKSGFYGGGLGERTQFGNARTQSHWIYNLLSIGTSLEYLRLPMSGPRSCRE